MFISLYVGSGRGAHSTSGTTAQATSDADEELCEFVSESDSESHILP